MVSPLTQCQITFPVHLDRPVARQQLWWLNSACKLLETRLLQVREGRGQGATGAWCIALQHADMYNPPKPMSLVSVLCLLQKLRFEMGDLYTVSVGNFFGCDAPSSTAPQLRGDVSIAFTCDPANKVRQWGQSVGQSVT